MTEKEIKYAAKDIRHHIAELVTEYNGWTGYIDSIMNEMLVDALNKAYEQGRDDYVKELESNRYFKPVVTSL